MATIKVFSAEGVKELKCFDILQNVDFLLPIEDEDPAEEDAQASDDFVDF